MPPRYSALDRALFYLDYFYRKTVALWFEVRRPKLRMFVYEMLYSARKLLDYKSMYPSPFGVEAVETVFGKFRVRPRTLDMSNASPAFERRDMDYLLGLLHRLRLAGKRTLFVDVGADIGTFAIAVGNRFRRYEALVVMAFEPAGPSFRVLRENIALNGLQNKVEPFNVALYSRDGELGFSYSAVSPGTSGIRHGAPGDAGKVAARTLDTALAGRWGHFDAIVMKLDVEGAECEVLKGAGGVLSSGAEVYLMVEDFVEPGVTACLEAMGARFVAKRTPYNSFWRFGG